MIATKWLLGGGFMCVVVVLEGGRGGERGTLLACSKGIHLMRVQIYPIRKGGSRMCSTGSRGGGGTKYCLQ